MEPFFNSLVRQLGIPDVFSLQMCGAGLSANSAVDPAGGSLVSGRGGNQMNIATLPSPAEAGSVKAELIKLS